MENWIVSQFGNLPDDSDGKEFACSSGDLGSIPGLERSPREGNDNPLQNSCLGNRMDKEAWQSDSSWGYKRVGYDLATKKKKKYIYVYMLMYSYI